MWVQVLKRTRGINHFQKYFSIISANISRRLESYAGLPSGSNVRDTVLIFNITNPNYAHPSHEWRDIYHQHSAHFSHRNATKCSSSPPLPLLILPSLNERFWIPTTPNWCREPPQNGAVPRNRPQPRDRGLGWSKWPCQPAELFLNPKMGLAGVDEFNSCYFGALIKHFRAACELHGRWIWGVKPILDFFFC